MITPQMRRLLALAQLVTPEVVRLDQEGDIESVAARFCNATMVQMGAPPATPEEVRDVAEIVGAMLAARFWANRAEPATRRPLGRVFGFGFAQHPVPGSRPEGHVPGGA